MVDSYHDRRSGFAFWVNPDGVKRDFAFSNDQNQDGSWDGDRLRDRTVPR